MFFSALEHDPQDASAVEWILPSLGDFGAVGGLVPSGYESFLLIDHTPPDSAPGFYRAGPELLDALASVLVSATETPDRAWFAIWEGYGLQSNFRVLPQFDLPHRRYHLLTAGVTDAGDLNFTGIHGPWAPDLWWPDDRRWFVATDTDLGWSYLGADEVTVSAVERLLPGRTERVSRNMWNSEFPRGA